MRLRIHRGATEVGGNCIEVETGGKSLLLDLGLPLGAAGADKELLPPVLGLADGGSDGLLGVVLSHPHVDHYGLLACAHPGLSVYLGEGACKLLRAAAPFTKTNALPQSITPYRNRKGFAVGPFRIVPFLMDHSAFDAYALLVEADGKRVFYSGDFRGHGRKAGVFERFLHGPPKGIDVLLMEGTTLGREAKDVPASEAVLEDRIASSIQNTPGLALACFSAQNIDRFVTFYRATLRSNRSFIADMYTACLLDALGLPSLPSPPSVNSRIRVFLPKRQKLRIVRTRRFELVEPYKGRRIYASGITASPARWVMMFRSSMIEDIEVMGNLAGGKLIYSLWSGYLDRDKPDLRHWCADRGLAFEIQHTSGHAHARDLARMVEVVAPRRLVPVHTARPADYAKIFPNVEMHANGEWFDV